LQLFRGLRKIRHPLNSIRTFQTFLKMPAGKFAPGAILGQKSSHRSNPAWRVGLAALIFSAYWSGIRVDFHSTRAR
jgi:hypothetical protein